MGSPGAVTGDKQKQESKSAGRTRLKSVRSEGEAPCQVRQPGAKEHIRHCEIEHLWKRDCTSAQGAAMGDCIRDSWSGAEETPPIPEDLYKVNSH